jgi:uncharacterized membrane protein
MNIKVDQLFELPAHPLFVHLPIVLIPLAALGTIFMAVRPSLRAKLGWAVATVAGIATVFAWLAKQSGGKLAGHVGRSPLLGKHAKLGSTMPRIALGFFVLVLALVIVDRVMAHRREAPDPLAVGNGHRVVRTATGPVVTILAVLTVLAGMGATVRIIQVGHSGSKVTWADVVKQTPKGSAQGNKSGQGD